MMNEIIIENMQEITERVNALQGLMDMAEAYSAQQPTDPRRDYLAHVAQIAHGMLSDIEASINEAASELMANSLETVKG